MTVSRRELDAWTRQEHHAYAQEVERRMDSLERRLTGLMAGLAVIIVLGNVALAALVARASF